MRYPKFPRSHGLQNPFSQSSAGHHVPNGEGRPRFPTAKSAAGAGYAVLRCAALPGLLSMLTAVVACAPTLDWRDAWLDSSQVRSSLPCKPERLERPTELAGKAVDLHMLGCEAAQSTFALACAVLPEAAPPAAVLTHWRAAVLASMGTAAGGKAGSKDVPYRLAGALELPQSVRTEAKGTTPEGGAVHLQAVWFARVNGSQVSACHAIVFGPRPQVEAGQQFFESLALR